MERKILPFGDPVLRKVAKPVTTITPKWEKLLDDMADTLYHTDDGAALAAPQVGILRRVIVMHGPEGLIELINPEIVEESGEQIGPEACLSFPGYFGIVKRANRVRVKYSDRKGNTAYMEEEGFFARGLQHEIDHLNGVLFIDHVIEDEFYHRQTNQKADLLAAIRLSNKHL